MYVPPAFATDDADALQVLERAAFGALVTHGAEGLAATQLPFLVERDPLKLIGHVARSNPHWREGDGAAMLIVQGANAYVSPSAYPSKAEHGRVVPTWNYEVVHVHGTLRWFEDRARLLRVVERLTARFERDRQHPWAVSDAPDDYIERMLAAIVGVEFHVARIEAARKLSQNRNAADRDGVLTALSASPEQGDQAVAEAMRS
jgi:transcriptional regulator